MNTTTTSIVDTYIDNNSLILPLIIGVGGFFSLFFVKYIFYKLARDRAIEQALQEEYDNNRLQTEETVPSTVLIEMRNISENEKIQYIDI